MLEAAFVAGLASEGVEVHRLGVVPTPVVVFEASRRDAMGAMISASHNPYQDNGIKLFARGGQSCPTMSRSASSTRWSGLPAPTGEPAQLHDAEQSPDYGVARPRVDRGSLARRASDRRRRRERRELQGRPALFRRAGADVIAISDQPDGRNINDRCGATHTAALSAAVIEHRADIGLALDGDADRLMAVDGTGSLVDGDQVMAICATDFHQRGLLRDATIVATVMSNLGFPHRDGAGRDRRRRDGGRRPLRAGGARRRRLHDGRGAERARHLPRSCDDRGWIAHGHRARRQGRGGQGSHWPRSPAGR